MSGTLNIHSDDPDVLKRRAQVATMMARHMKTWQIVEALGLPRGSGDSLVNNDIRCIKEGWKIDNKERLESARTELVEELRELRRELWNAWEASKKEAMSTSVSSRKIRAGKTKSQTVYDEEGEEVKEKDLVTDGETKTVNVSKREGNAVYTNQIMQSIDAEATLLGLMAKDGATGDSAPPVMSFKIHSPQSKEAS